MNVIAFPARPRTAATAERQAVVPLAYYPPFGMFVAATIFWSTLGSLLAICWR